MKLLTLVFLALFSSAAGAQTNFRGAMVWKSGSPQSIDQERFAQVTFNTVIYDTCGCWDADRHRMVVPIGARFVRLQAQLIFAHMQMRPEYSLNNRIRQVVIKQNFVSLEGWYDNRPGWAVGQSPAHTASTTDVHAVGPVLQVQPGDDFMVEAFHSEIYPVEIRATNGTWFSIEIVE